MGLAPLAAGFVMVLGFLLAAFAVRNSDVWQHLAVGRLVASGQYVPGVDPFGQDTAGRYWVNHAWLFDTLLYLGYWISGPNGTLLVSLKAFAVALLAGVLLQTRPTAQSLWPGVVTTWLALVASAPRFMLQPIVVSFVGLAVTAWLVQRLLATPTERRWWWALAGLMVAWVNLDAWFFMGPTYVGLVCLGLHLEHTARPTEATALQRQSLLRVLGLMVVASLLNPHLLWAWQLPYELTSSGVTEGLAGDRLFMAFFLSALSTDFWLSPQLGYNWNGAAYVTLVLGSLLCLLGDRANVSWWKWLTWIAGLALSLSHARAIPFFAIIAAPLLAEHLSRLLARSAARIAEREAARVAEPPLKSVAAPSKPRRSPAQTRAVLAGLVRGWVLMGTLAACVWAVPGWWHPLASHPAYQRRLGFTLIPDAGLARLAETLQRWRSDGRIPADVRGVANHPDLAHYCAWYAPAEKVWVDTRLHLFADRWVEYTQLRKACNDATQTIAVVNPLCAKYQWHYLALTDTDRGATLAALQQLWADLTHWNTWYLDGKAALVGYCADPSAPPAGFRALNLNLTEEAFGPAARIVKAPAPPNPPAPWWDVTAVPLPPATDTHTSELLLTYHLHLNQRGALRGTGWSLGSLLAQVGGGPLLVCANYAPLGIEQTLDAHELGSWYATALLAVRAARRAIASNPDDPEAYLALARAYPFCPTNREYRRVGTLAALVQGLERAQVPGSFTRPMNILEAYERLKREAAAIRSLDLLERTQERQFLFASKLGHLGAAEQAQLLKELEQQLLQTHEGVQRVRSDYELKAVSQGDVQRANLALQAGLAWEAITVLRRNDRMLTDNALNIADVLIRRLGEAEAAAKWLERSGPTAQLPPQLQLPFRERQLLVALARGNFTEAGSAAESALALLIASKPPTPAAAFGLLLPDLSPTEGLTCGPRWQMYSVLTSAWLSWAARMCDWHVGRAFLALEEGDLPTAQQHLDAALAPRDGNVLDFDGRGDALRYRRWLQKYGVGGRR